MAETRITNQNARRHIGRLIIRKAPKRAAYTEEPVILSDVDAEGHLTIKYLEGGKNAMCHGVKEHSIMGATADEIYFILYEEDEG